MQMPRKLTSRSRARLHRSMSLPSKGKWRFSTFLAVGGFFLLACVVFLQVWLSGFRSYAQDLTDNQDRNLLKRNQFETRFFDGDSVQNMVAAGKVAGGESMREQVERDRLLGDDGLDDVDALEREVVTLDTDSRAALTRRTGERDRVIKGIGRMDMDEARLEKLEADLDMENDELEEFESFGGNFLNEMDAHRDPKGEGMDDSDFGLENEEPTVGSGDKMVAGEEGNEKPKVTERESVQLKKQVGEKRQPAEMLEEEVREMEDRQRGDQDDALPAKGTKRLKRLGHIKTLPRLEVSRNQLASTDTAGDVEDVGLKLLGGVRRSVPEDTTLSRNLNHVAVSTDTSRKADKMWFLWDHVLGVHKKPLGQPDGKFSGTELDFPKMSSKVVFSTDDEPVEEDLRSKVDAIVDIEDAFFLKNQKLFKTPKSGKKASDGDAGKKEGAVDLLNPINNPLLTDPDSMDTGALTKNDKTILKLLRGIPSTKEYLPKKPMDEGVKLATRWQSHEALPARNLAEKIEAGEENEQSRMIEVEGDGKTHFNGGLRLGAEQSNPFRAVGFGKLKLKPIDVYVESAKDRTSGLVRDEVQSLNEAGLSSSRTRVGQKDVSKASGNHVTQHVSSGSWPLAIPPASQQLLRGKSSSRRHQQEAGMMRWGNFPGIDPFLSFSAFMKQFLGDQSCSLQVFMVWATHPWSYTVRYQRGLESLLHFHPKACVVVLSETVDTDLFKEFVQTGYRVAAVKPNLGELLQGTPADVFASVWQSWRKIPLYYIHSSELLRLASLYKYGGLYLDSDVIVLKPLTDLRNTIGAEFSDIGNQRLNGAVMAFDRASPFLRECLEEFTATYDDKLLGWNGGGLLTRVAKRHGDSPKLNADERPKIEPHTSFYPIESACIQKFFHVPENHMEKQQHLDLLATILQESYTLHFWNRLTARIVPESGSLVASVLDQYCLHCAEAV